MRRGVPQKKRIAGPRLQVGSVDATKEATALNAVCLRSMPLRSISATPFADRKVNTGFVPLRLFRGHWHRRDRRPSFPTERACCCRRSRFKTSNVGSQYGASSAAARPEFDSQCIRCMNVNEAKEGQSLEQGQ